MSRRNPAISPRCSPSRAVCAGLLEFELQVDALQDRVSELVADLDQALDPAQRSEPVFAARTSGTITVAPGRCHVPEGLCIILW